MSVTGICQSLNKLSWLDDTYIMLRAFDALWSKQRGYNPSIKLTTIKPSGSVSLLTGSSPGVHPAYAKYYIRRIRVASDHELCRYAELHGYKTEFSRRFDDTLDYSTKIVEIVCSSEDSLVAADMSAVEQLELVKLLQTKWSDNAISVTVYYKAHELVEIQAWLAANYETSVKAVSFLRHSDHGFVQAPYEEITKEQYENTQKGYAPLTPFNVFLEMSDEECATGICPVR
jgi:ribonucleoside-diphosphate reductase alpha chain/ribonucleoside-triphosphate reductase